MNLIYMLLKTARKLMVPCINKPVGSIGKNSIIGAHSLVNKDIPDNVVAFGVPAKIIRKLNNVKY